MALYEGGLACTSRALQDSVLSGKPYSAKRSNYSREQQYFAPRLTWNTKFSSASFSIGREKAGAPVPPSPTSTNLNAGTPSGVVCPGRACKNRMIKCQMPCFIKEKWRHHTIRNKTTKKAAEHGEIPGNQGTHHLKDLSRIPSADLLTNTASQHLKN